MDDMASTEDSSPFDGLPMPVVLAPSIEDDLDPAPFVEPF